MKFHSTLTTAVLLIAISSYSVVHARRKREPKARFPVLAIDMGARFTRAAVYNNVTDTIEIVLDETGRRYIPNYVAYPDSTTQLVGAKAEEYWLTDGWNNVHMWNYRTAYDVKRVMEEAFEGCRKNDQWPPSAHYQLVFKLGHFDLTLENVTAEFILKMKHAEQQINAKIQYAIIVVPSNYDIDKREAIKRAAELADVTALRILNEATAAAVACGLIETNDEKNYVFVDLGAGTLDVTLATAENGVLEHRATNRTYNIAGNVFDRRVTEHLYDTYLQNIGPRRVNDMTDNLKKMIKREIMNQVRNTKPRLETYEYGRSIVLPLLYFPTDSVTDLCKFNERVVGTLTRGIFEQKNNDLFENILERIDQTLSDDGELTKADIHEYVLLGGSSRIPKVRQLLKEYFDGKPPACQGSTEPDELIVFGTAQQGRSLSMARDDVITEWRIHGAENLFDIGVETKGGVMSTVMPRGEWSVGKGSRNFTVAYDLQEVVAIKVLEGNRPLAADNYLMHTFTLTGLQPRLKKDTQIEISIERDVNGIVHLTAEEKHPDGKRKMISITPDDTDDRTADDIDDMMEDIHDFAEQDKKLREQLVDTGELEDGSLLAFDTRRLIKGDQLTQPSMKKQEL